MVDKITLALPDDIQEAAQRLAKFQEQLIEDILIDRLRTSMLPIDVQNELNALKYLSDDALWTIAKEQLEDNLQVQFHVLLERNNLGILTDIELNELNQLNARADELMLRKAEASSILRKRGHNFSQEDFLPNA